MLKFVDLVAGADAESDEPIAMTYEERMAQQQLNTFEQKSAARREARLFGDGKPLTYPATSKRVAPFSAAEQSAQIAYDKRVQQRDQRMEEARLDRVRQAILNLGQ